MHYAVCGERSVIDHDGGPANELQYIQDSKKDASLLSKTHFYGFHGTFSDPAADHARRARNDVLRHIEHSHSNIKGVGDEIHRHPRLENPLEEHERIDVVHIVLFRYHAD